MTEGLGDLVAARRGNTADLPVAGVAGRMDSSAVEINPTGRARLALDVDHCGTASRMRVTNAIIELTPLSQRDLGPLPCRRDHAFDARRAPCARRARALAVSRNG
jgi:hypothetical protein